MVTWLLSPRSINGRMLAGKEGGVGDGLWFLLVILLGVLPAQVVSVAMTWDRGILSLLIQMAQLFMGFAIGPLAVTLLLGLGLAVAARVKGRSASVDGLMAAASYLVIPVGLLALLGALWTQWIGVQRFLPGHLEAVAFVEGQVDLVVGLQVAGRAVPLRLLQDGLQERAAHTAALPARLNA